MTPTGSRPPAERAEALATELSGRFIEAFNRGDAEGCLELLDQDVKWTVAPEAPAPGTHRGRDAVRAYLEDWFGTVSGLRLELISAELMGDRLLTLARLKGSAQGAASLAVPLGFLSTIKEGRLVEVQEFLDPDAARRAALDAC